MSIENFVVGSRFTIKESHYRLQHPVNTVHDGRPYADQSRLILDAYQKLIYQWIDWDTDTNPITKPRTGIVKVIDLTEEVLPNNQIWFARGVWELVEVELPWDGNAGNYAARPVGPSEKCEQLDSLLDSPTLYFGSKQAQLINFIDPQK